MTDEEFDDIRCPHCGERLVRVSYILPVTGSVERWVECVNGHEWIYADSSLIHASETAGTNDDDIDVLAIADADAEGFQRKLTNQNLRIFFGG